MAFDWTSLIGPAIGALAGGAASGDTQTTSSKDPWAAAQPYMLGNLQRTNDLDRAYQANPFSDQQKQMYGNQFADIGNFRDNIMPGLMNFANQGMSGGYQRGASTIPGGGGYQRPQGQQAGPFGLLGGGGASTAANLFQTPTVPAVDKTNTNPLQSGLLGTQPGADGNWGGGAQGGDTGGGGTESGYGGVWGGNPLANIDPKEAALAAAGGPISFVSFMVSNWGKLSDEQKAQVAAYAKGEGGYGTTSTQNGPPNADQAAAIAASFAKDFGGYGGGNQGGYGNNADGYGSDPGSIGPR